jgi:AraC-like DNA-binding protein
MHSLYFEPERCALRWSVPTAVHTSGFVGALLAHLVDAPAGPARRHAELLAFELLEPARTAIVRVPRLVDDRLARIADALHRDPGDPRTLPEWGRLVGASGRTLARLVERDTGMGFERWRTSLRIAHAAQLLAAGETVTSAGARVGYATPSAFVAAFRRVVGVPPGTYASTPRRSTPRRDDTTGPTVVPAGLVVQVRDDLVDSADVAGSRQFEAN